MQQRQHLTQPQPGLLMRPKVDDQILAAAVHAIGVRFLSRSTVSIRVPSIANLIGRSL
jgi:hypothetical protein